MSDQPPSLNPCRKCGGEAHITFAIVSKKWVVFCWKVCGQESIWNKDELKALLAWNEENPVDAKP